MMSRIVPKGFWPDRRREYRHAGPKKVHYQILHERVNSDGALPARPLRRMGGD